MIYTYKSKSPLIHSTAFIAPSADIIGDVTVGPNSSIWFNVTIRGDVHYIKIGDGTSVQDNSMLHVTNGKYPLNLGNNVTIAHSVTLHGCTINDNTLIGMGTIILDDAEIGENSIVAAGSLIREGKHFSPGVLIAGAPANEIRQLREEEIEKNMKYASNYVAYKNIYLDGAQFQRIDKENYSG